jgi:hypothetical protein
MKDSKIIQDNDPKLFLREEAITELTKRRTYLKNLGITDPIIQAEFAKTVVKYDKLILKLKGLI